MSIASGSASSVPGLIASAARHLRAGRPDLALTPLREAARLDPLNAAVLHDLGLASLEVGSLASAEEAFRGAIAARPRFAEAYFHLAIALERGGSAHQAVAAYDRATELKPSFPEAWFRAGALVENLGHAEEALGCFRRAMATGPKTSFGKLAAARVLMTERRDTEAVRALRQLLALDRDNAMALDLLGNLLSEAGQFDEARACFARVVALAPRLAGSYYDLVRCRRVTAEDGEVIARMLAALNTPGLEPAQRMRLHLAIGKAADDLDDVALASAHFDAADDVRRATLAFDGAELDRQVDRMIALFTPELLARASGFGRDDATPLLIVGMPRSGTTLTEQIVSSHPDVAGADELNFWTERGIAWVRAGEAGLDSEFLRRAADDYLRTLHAVSSDAARVTDKMPFNFLWAGLIHLALPRATIIHCRRAAIDTALSIHQTHFNPTLAFPTGGAELVAYFHTYRRLTDHWRRVLPRERFIEIEYERLTSDAEPQIRELIERIGLRWDDSCLRPDLNPRAVRTPSKWQARQPIHRASIQRWRRYEPWLGALRPLLGFTADA